ncbi:amino acid ABC transporter permease [Oceanidesulfovibrio marinus]|uniref:Putative glutamine transport system permease protein GlnP n=1 Tax=Oceanidesulfovibrio marinus TaxID=370038 RepID=A0A6P1ZEP3_9BACT|nr:amino acid ABC transporter permease [Oceanidesulfovibrio marinus]QJT07727.1 amino acid ABC transporter permease [Oceanidesulfovibrio marinus]TVM32081.1 amino acid ABC transporter permease [Oceanidesulfovibrio marinus]
MDFQFDILTRASGDLLLGAWITIKISVLSFLLALIIGFVVGAARARSAFWSRITAPYVEIFRGTPLLIQLFFIYYGLPTVGIKLGGMTAAYVGLGLNGGAYIAEIIRGALLGVEPGQEEAALSTGLTPIQALLYVLFPQALRTAVPPLVNSFSALLKDSSLVSVLAITELTRMGQLVYTRTFRPFEIYLAIGAIYLLMTYCVSWLSKFLEHRLSYGR